MRLRVSAQMILFPEARRSPAAMAAALRYLRGQVDMVEFYYEGGDDDAVAAVLREVALASVFVAVVPLKEKKLDLCALDEADRRAAVAEVEGCIDRARALGSEAVMVCSGRNPADPADVPRCLDAFVCSMREIASHMDRTGPALRLLLEPCDSGIDARHLIGPTALAIEAVRRVRAFCPTFALTMDTAHVSEQGEDFLAAMALARPYCHHVHFANCVTADRDDPLYGDKHVGFDHPGGDVPYAELERIFGALEALYAGDALDIALEVLPRAVDPYAHFEAMKGRLPRLFAARGDRPQGEGMPMRDARELQRIADRLRLDVVETIHAAGDGHPAPALSIAELMAVLYFSVLRVDPRQPRLPQRDRFILSKGHACPILYAALARRGFFPLSELPGLRALDSMLQGHPDMNKTPGVDATSGSLGNGVSIGLGMAMGTRHQGYGARVYVVVGDGEQEEGIIWEAAMAAAAMKADNLVVFADCNDYQSGGHVTDLSALYPLLPKWEAFGWHCQEIDGHDIDAIRRAIDAAHATSGRPSLIALRTVKGKGVPYMENNNAWHKRVPTDEELAIARDVLGGDAR